MRHLFLAIHHPKPEHAAELTDAMVRFGADLAQLPGMLQASAWSDGERIVAMSIWESRGRLVAAHAAMAASIANVPFDSWEERPRELFNLDALAT